MIKKSIVVLSVCLLAIAGSAWAQTQYVLDTGDPNERVCNPKSYTDFGNGIVRDNVTGLEWQQSTAPGIGSGSYPDQYTWQQALDYVAGMNAGTHENYGYADWRLPTIEELSTLVDAGRYNPAIDSVFSTVVFGYWSSTTYAGDTFSAWRMSFYEGKPYIYVPNNKAHPGYVRAVRGGQYGTLHNFVINGDGTVTDPNRGFMWQQCNYGQTWNGTECIGTATYTNLAQAFAYVQELNDTHYLGYEDWRLPTRNELQSLVDYSRMSPATTFPTTRTSYYYWSSTMDVSRFPPYAWGVLFFNGDVEHVISRPDYPPMSISPSYVRALRSGSCWADLAECLGDNDCDDGVFCNGAETCVEGLCIAGSLPCIEGQICDESNGQCVECLEDGDCSEGEVCVEGICEPIPDSPPAISDGPYVAAGAWPVLSTSQASPTYLDANNYVLWTFSDDFASCSEACEHMAEYQAVGGSEWTALEVTANAAKGYAYAELPVESLQNATTYAFRYSVTDCASQTTQSYAYYFRVAVTDAPPVITSPPFVAAGTWPALSTSASKAIVLDQNYNVLWTFSDDYAGCTGLCTHRARYKKVDDATWTWLSPVNTDSEGAEYAYAMLPVKSLNAGTYQFYFDVRDCAGQRTYAPKVYYFKVE